jgi:hypothetical protein
MTVTALSKKINTSVFFFTFLIKWKLLHVITGCPTSLRAGAARRRPPILQLNEIIFKFVVRKKRDERSDKAIWVWVRIKPRSSCTGAVCATYAPLHIHFCTDYD